MTKHEYYKIQSKYWIDRNGKIYKYKGKDIKDIISIHAEIAYSLYPNIEHPKDFLLKCGWIMVGCSYNRCNIIYKEPSQAQINKLFDLNMLYTLVVLNEKINC